MGQGFVILIFLIGIFIISGVVAILSVLLTVIISSKTKRKRRIVVAAFSPFIGFYTLFFVTMISAFVISDIKDVDVGIGDTWFVPLNEDWRLLMIDGTDRAYLERGDRTIMADVSQIRQIGNKVYGKTAETFATEKYFSLDLRNQQRADYDDIEALAIGENVKDITLADVSKFYDHRKTEIMGAAKSLIWLLSFATAAATVFLFGRVVLYGGLSVKKPRS